MHRVLNFLSKYKAPALLIALALCFFILKESTNHDHDGHDNAQAKISTADSTNQKAPSDHHDHDDSHNHDHDGTNKKSSATITEEQKEKLKELATFSFPKEQERVNRKLLDYEANKEELITIILKPDPYHNLPTPPHTIHSLLKNQRGAFKVWTLRKVAAKEGQSQKLFERILAEAKDNTLKNIAKTALDLIEQGSKDPLKDIANGIENLDGIPVN